jgi:hypothetical protein
MDAASVLLAAGAVLGTTAIEESTKLAIGGLWSSLKSLVSARFGAGGPALAVLEEVESQPLDLPAPEGLTARIGALRLMDDPEVAALLKRIEAMVAERAPSHIQKQYNFYAPLYNSHFS